MKNIDLKQIQSKLKEYQDAEITGQNKIIILQQELTKTKQQVITMQGAIAAMIELLPKEKKQNKKIVSFKKNKEVKNGKQKT